MSFRSSLLASLALAAVLLPEGAEAAPKVPAAAASPSAPIEVTVPVGLSVDGGPAGTLEHLIRTPLPATPGVLGYGSKFEFTIGSDMPGSFYSWLGKSVSNPAAPPEANGSVVLADPLAKSTKTIWWKRGVIHSVSIPGATMGAKVPLHFAVTMTSPSVKTEESHGRTTLGPATTKSVARFRLAIDGIGDKALSRILKVDGLQLTAGGAPPAKGEPPRAPVTFTLTLPAADAKEFFDWAAPFANGKRPESAEKSAKVDYVGSDGATIFTVGYDKLGIDHLHYEAGPIGNMDTQLTVHLYARDVSLTFPGAP